MIQGVKSESRKSKQRVFKPNHAEPGAMFFDYILLPYGMYYEKTRVLLEAKTGDILRFFNGPEYRIESVFLISCDRQCDMLCRMRYGISWEAALTRWKRYALLEGHGKNILSTKECIIVFYDKES